MPTEKTADAKEWFNQFLNPLEYDKLPRSINDTPTDTMMKHLPTLAVGFGGLGMLVRYIKHQKDQAGITKSNRKLQSYVEARNPILSLDPSTRDTKKEQKEKSIGVQETEYDPALEKISSGEWGSVEDANSTGAEVLRNLSGTEKHWLHPSLAIAVALAGGIGGWKLMDRKLGDMKGKALNKEIEQEENNIDKLLYDEYVKSRGLDKAASGFDVSQAPVEAPATHTGNLWEMIKSPSKAGALLMSSYGIAALGIMALSYKASREFSNNRDPNRKRMSEMQAALEEKGRFRNAPIFTDISNFPDKGTAKKPTSATTGVQVPKKTEDKNPVKAPMVDEADPYASLLQQG